MLDCKEEIPQRPLSLSNQGFQKSNQEQPTRLASRSSDECEWKSSAVGLAQLSPSPAWSTQNGDALKYGGDASLLLIGVRGAGKTSLAIMASSVMSRKVINIDHAFHATLGLSPQQYKATHGLAECQEQQLRLLRAVFGRYHRHYYDLEESSNWDSPIWLSMYLKADSLGCHFVRLIRPATSSEENRQVSNFRAQISQLEDAKAILIAYNSGTLGRTSAIFNDVLTETRPSTPNSTMITSPGSSQAPSITALEATTALFSSFARDTLNFYVFGRDVDYSLSPAMMTSALRACGLPHQYRPWSTPTLQEIRHLTEDPLFGGGTVSYPLKVEALDLAHSISKHAQAIGAVNTLIPIRCLEKDGSVPTGARFFKQITQSGPVQALHGENTDWIGIGTCVLRGLSPANAVTPSSSCLILGAGGMGRAAIYSMLRLGVRNIVVYNRTRSNAERVVSHLTKLVRDSESQKDGDISSTRFSILTNIDEAWPDDFRLPSIIISCIPIEAYEEPSSPPFVIPKDYLANKTGGVALEIAYKTLDTPLIVQAKKEAARGWVVMDGLDILPEQGFAQFELFTVRRAPQHVMRSEIRLRSSHS
ncbi:hypothetical protein KJ359_012366 [Pestalotiopsis sp. 9143b]|nr:hypothetical protein KJ359_012366 [Pestalotiopsis sp. 9143b]